MSQTSFVNFLTSKINTKLFAQSASSVSDVRMYSITLNIGYWDDEITTLLFLFSLFCSECAGSVTFPQHFHILYIYLDNRSFPAARVTIAKHYNMARTRSVPIRHSLPRQTRGHVAALWRRHALRQEQSVEAAEHNSLPSHVPKRAKREVKEACVAVALMPQLEGLCSYKYCKMWRLSVQQRP